MSDLVERVARALAGKYLAPSEGTYDTARDVIKAVAEWVREAGSDDMYARAFSKMIFDELKEGSE